MEVQYIQVFVKEPSKDVTCEAKDGLKLLGNASEFGEMLMRGDRLVEAGRLSVLQEFDAVCKADGFMGFTDEEWSAVKKFFAFNKEVSGWDKQ